jgi:dTDP-4-dehydrorhamnose reductase
MRSGSGPILVTGGSGQLARALEAAAGGRNLVRVGRPEFDFDRLEAIPPLLDSITPALVVNAAAYTAVDQAETDREAAWRTNCEGPGVLAQWCAKAGVPLIHISTDYVYDGLKGAPYEEDDPTSPMGVYGASKLAGEHAVQASGAAAIILRTSWVYAASGKNFVLTMLNAARKTNRLRVVADQRGCPTLAADLADAILAIADRVAEEGWNAQWQGIYHAAGSGETTWHGFAQAIFARAARHGLPRPEVAAITTQDWPTPARRPPDSRLDCGKLFRTFGLRLPPWEESLARTVDVILA